jgi:galactokinase
MFHLILRDIESEEWIDPTGPIEYQHRRDYLRSSINVLKRIGVDFDTGYDCVVRGEVPINAGASSSSVLVVSWIKFLLEVARRQERFDLDQIAQYGYAAEVLEFKEPGGMMDHYAASFGGVLYIRTRHPFKVYRASVRLNGFVLGNSLEPKGTTEVLGEVKNRVLEGFGILRKEIPHFDPETASLTDIGPSVQILPEDISRKVRANFINRDLCEDARALLMGVMFEPKRLGELLTLHHEQLREGLGISTPKIEKMIEASMSAGALGCKINGSGGGGCMFAYAPGKQQEVAEAIIRVGGRAYIVDMDAGVRVD